MFRRLHERLDRIDNRIELIDRMLLIKDPGASRAPDAYEGLRKQVVASVQERRAHLADLAQIDGALDAGESVDDLRVLMRDLMGRLGLQRASDPSVHECYEVVAGEGDTLDVVAPCYVDSATGQLIRQGRAHARRSDSAPTEPEPSHGEALSTNEVTQ